MAARRLVILMVVLLAISSVAALLVPPPEPSAPPRETTTRTDSKPREAAGELVRATIDASRPRPGTVRLRAGDQLVLRVVHRRPDQVEIPRLGEIADVDPDAPATFDLLPPSPGTYTIRLVGERRTIGRIVVVRERDDRARTPARDALQAPLSGSRRTG